MLMKLLRTGSDLKVMAEISPPADTRMMVLQSRNGVIYMRDHEDIEMGPFLLRASFSGLQRYSQNYRVKIYTVLEGRKIAAVSRDTRLYPRLRL